jgi:hypothetical protein
MSSRTTLPTTHRQNAAWMPSSLEAPSSPQSKRPRRRLRLSFLTRRFFFFGRSKIQSLPVNYPNSNNSTEIRVYQTVLEDARVLQMANSLRGNIHTTSIHLNDNGITDQGAFALGKVLPFTRLRRVSLSGNPFIGAVGIAAIAESLTGMNTSANDTHSVQALNLGNINMGNVPVQALAKCLHTNTSLRELLLQSNMIGNDGAIALGDALRANTHLRALDLSDNSIGDVGVVAILNGLRHNTTLKHLFLGDNRVSLTSLIKWQELLATDNASLEILDAKDHNLRGRQLTTNVTTAAMVKKEKVLAKIDHYLELNRNGRRWLREEPNRAMLPYIYHRVAHPPMGESPEVLYGLIRELPHLICRSAVQYDKRRFL